MAATEQQILFVKECIANDDMFPFYNLRAWKRLRRDILSIDKKACQVCKEHGTYTRATVVHHINHVRDHPELCLSEHFIDGKGKMKRNLISVCKNCHETVCHPEKLRIKEEPLTKEWWG